MSSKTPKYKKTKEKDLRKLLVQALDNITDTCLFLWSLL